jgi:glycosyltransferase involved in cell wall biosynthesis
MPPKKILYAAPFWQGSSAVPRLRGLQKLGLEVVSLDTTSWVGNSPRIWRSLTQRLYFSNSVREMNSSLLRTTARTSPQIVLIDKGSWVYPLTLGSLHRKGCLLVHYNTDDIFTPQNHFWLHRLFLKYYDLYLTTNRLNVIEIHQRYGIRTFRAGMGYDQEFHIPLPTGDLSNLKDQVIFIGHWEPHIERYIVALNDNGIKVKVWGHNWWKARTNALRVVKPLPRAEYVKTIAQAKIALCFLSHWNRNESTGRSFEIPAIGTFMLAERTAEHKFLYGDGVGAALFSSEKELVDKVSYYLAHPEERQTIAAKGRARCQELGLSWADHMQREWPIMERLLIREGTRFHQEEDQPFWSGFRQGLPWRIECMGK